MANDSHAWIRSQHALDALRHHIAAVSNCYLACVERVAYSYSSSVVDRNPRCTCGCVEQRVQQRPIGDCVGTGFHAFGFTERGRDGSTIQMIRSDYEVR